MVEAIQRIPPLHLIIFIGGLAAAVALLIFLKVKDRHKKKKSDKFGEYDE